MPRIFVSPAEPTSLREPFTTSPIPEKWGVDFFWISSLGTLGIQRKAIPDLLASADDGRLSRETKQMQMLDIAILIVEGKPHWTNEGQLIQHYGPSWTRTRHRNYLRSLQLEGVWVEFSDSPADTIELIAEISEWSCKAHRSFDRRGDSPHRDQWGRATSRDWSRHVLQGFDGIGPKNADAILDHFDRLPLRWDITREQLEEVHGMGAKTVDRLFKSIGGPDGH